MAAMKWVPRYTYSPATPTRDVASPSTAWIRRLAPTATTPPARARNTNPRNAASAR